MPSHPASQLLLSSPSLSDVIRDLLHAETPDLLNLVVGEAVRMAFEAHHRNQVQTALALGISRNSLRTHLANLGYIQSRRKRGGLPAGR